MNSFISRGLRRDQALSLEVYKRLLLRFNQKLNLYSRSRKFALDELLEESLAAAPALRPVFRPSLSVIDIGSGNGTPGLPLAVMFPKTYFTLCERGAEKAEFLRYAIFKMKIKNAKALCIDGKRLKSGPLKNSFPLAVAKGISSKAAADVLEAALAPKGRAFLWKSAHWRPRADRLSARVFASYKVAGKERVLVEARRRLV